MLPPISLTSGVLLAKLSLSVFLGGVIGFERELHGKVAGLRTNALICLGAALIMDLSIRTAALPDAHVGDPGRLAAQVVSGVGFLGAGAIMQSGGAVTGLTTAATIWVVAAIGLAVGAGQYSDAGIATALVAVVLIALRRVERYLPRVGRAGLDAVTPPAPPAAPPAAPSAMP